MNLDDIRAKIMAEHGDHRWTQIGRCVYCECGPRLYQGKVPKGHPTFTPTKKSNSAGAQMRARWGKD